MSWLWSQFQDLAFAGALIFAAYLAVQLVLWAVRDWRGFSAVLCGELALLFGMLAVLWAAVLADRYL